MTGVQVVQAGTTEFGFVNAPLRLFKFFSSVSHAQALVQRGCVRIGTLHEFHATDGWDELRGDEGEGKFTLSLQSAKPETITAESAPWYLRPIIDELGMPILSHGGTTNAMPQHPDAYIYCTTAIRTNSAVMGYGAFVVEIMNVIEFFTILTRHLIDTLGLIALEPHGYLAPCIYLDREMQVKSQDTEVVEPPLAFIKPPSKCEEQEVRAIWHPAGTEPKPLIIECPELTECCRAALAT
jgi:hypothetical protein